MFGIGDEAASWQLCILGGGIHGDVEHVSHTYGPSNEHVPVVIAANDLTAARGAASLWLAGKEAVHRKGGVNRASGTEQPSVGGDIICG